MNATRRRGRPLLYLATLALGLSFWAPVAWGAPPDVTYLSPAGGQRGSTVEVSAAGTFASWPAGVWVSGKGVSATAARAKGKLAVTIAADAVPGVYWLRAYDEQGGGNLRPFLVGTLPEVMEKEPNDAPRQAQPLPRGGVVVNGVLQKRGDVDCFAIELKKGQTLVASLEANATLKSPMDGVLQVVSADGFVLEHNHDFRGLDPQVTFAVPKDGKYLVRVFAFPAQPDASIAFAGADNFIYRLTVTTGGFADHARPLAVPRASPGTVALEGWNIPPAARKCAVPAADDGEDSAWVFHPEVANAVPVRLERHPTWDSTSAPARPAQTPPFTVTGRLEKPESANVVSFTGKKGEKLLIQAEAQALGFPLIPALRVRDAAGKVLARAEPARINRDAELSFTPPADGVYRVQVRDLHGEGGPRYLYRLRVVRPEPDFELTVASDRFQLTPGKPLDIPVQVVRQNGFDQEVALEVQGLPEGASATVLPAGKSARTITVRVTAEKAGAGAVRITGQAKGKPGPKRLARASLAAFGEKTADLWLSVLPPRPPPAGKK